MNIFELNNPKIRILTLKNQNLDKILTPTPNFDQKIQISTNFEIEKPL